MGGFFYCALNEQKWSPIVTVGIEKLCHCPIVFHSLLYKSFANLNNFNIFLIQSYSEYSLRKIWKYFLRQPLQNWLKKVILFIKGNHFFSFWIQLWVLLSVLFAICSFFKWSIKCLLVIQWVRNFQLRKKKTNYWIVFI